MDEEKMERIRAQCYLTSSSVNDSGTNNLTGWHYSCSEGAYELIEAMFFVLAMVAMIILTCLPHRCHQKCGGNADQKFCFFVSFPLNMLDGHSNRLAYSAIFGSMTFGLSSMLLDSYGRFSGSGIAYFFKLGDSNFVTSYPVIRLPLLLFEVIIFTFIYYPYFLALSSSYKFTASIIGVLLSLYRFCSWLWFCTCEDIDTTDIDTADFIVKRNLLPILMWPCILCMGLLTVGYIVNLVGCVRDRTFGNCSKPDPIAHPHHIEHVKYLLRKGPLPWSEPDLHHLSIFNKQKFLQSFSFRRLPGFMFPTRVIATLVVTALAIYQIGIRVAFGGYSVLKVIRRIVICAKALMPSDIAAVVLPHAQLILRYANILVYIWIAVLVLNCLLALFYLCRMCLSYRRHTLKIYQGDMSMFPRNWVRQDSNVLLSAASRHAGLQIAYAVWGLVIIQLAIFFICLVVTLVLVMPVVEFGSWDIIRLLLQVVVASIVINMAIYRLQVFMNKFLFLQNKINPSDEKQPLAIDNRKVWYNLSYFFFFWNLFLGIISALMRIIKGALLGIFFIPRLDRPVLMKGFEAMDVGFFSYLSLLSVINAHDHPVVKVFVKCLVDGVSADHKEFSSATELPVSDSANTDIELLAKEKPAAAVAGSRLARQNTVVGSKRAKYYWSLAYTLINNPDLLCYRKVEVDDVGSSGDTPVSHRDGLVKKHKIVLAIFRKKTGLKTSQMYEDEGKPLSNNGDSQPV